jgi:endonuclease YncB( thermonuclease family)
MGRIILAAFLLLAAPTAFADTLTGKVVKVADGDSITVLDSTNMQHRIRFVLAVVAIGFRLRNLSL